MFIYFEFFPLKKITYEKEHNGNISFLDVLITRRINHTKKFTVHQKPIHNNVYLHLESFSPEAWKTSTLKTYLLRARNICPNEELLA